MDSVTTSPEQAHAAQPSIPYPSRPQDHENEVALWATPSDSNVSLAAVPARETEVTAAADTPILVLSLCLVLAVAVIAGLVTAILSRFDAATFARSVLCGGAAFGTTLLIGFALIALL